MPQSAELPERIRSVRSDPPQLASQHLGADLDFERVSLAAHDCDVLRDLIAAERARSVIEIGLAFGSSALAIGEALTSLGSPGARHLIIDAYQDRFQNIGWEALVSAGLDQLCTLVRERSQIALPRLVAEEYISDAAFVDGSHIFHNVFVDLYFLRELVRPGGLLILDDCQWSSVATAVNYYVMNARWTHETVREETRLRAYRLPDPTYEPDFESFQPFAI